MAVGVGVSVKVGVGVKVLVGVRVGVNEDVWVGFFTSFGALNTGNPACDPCRNSIAEEDFPGQNAQPTVTQTASMIRVMNDHR